MTTKHTADNGVRKHLQNQLNDKRIGNLSEKKVQNMPSPHTYEFCFKSAFVSPTKLAWLPN